MGSYTYDVLDNLLTVVQSGSRNRTFVYNSLSQLSSATNPESGAVSYAYDNDGNLSSKLDARNVSTYYLYDSLHRLKERGHNDGTPTAYLYYDWAEWPFHTNVVGRLTHAVTSDSGWYEFGYDAMGRLKTEYQLLALPVTYDYNLDGSLKSVTYPNGTQISYTPNAAGRVTQVTSSLQGEGYPGTLASGIQYHPHGAVKQMTLGNGLVEINTYNNRLQPSQMRANNPSTGTDLLNMVYGFNLGTANNGNVMAWSATGQQTFSRTYTYDELNRIKTMAGTGGSCAGLSWTYDVWGNRTAQTVTGGSCPSPSFTVNSNNQLAGYGYDAAGNMISEPGKTYQYDAENRLKSINNGAIASYVYDASGRRVKKTVSGADTVYFYDVGGNAVAEYNASGAWRTAYVYLNGQLLAQYSGGASGTTYFAHKDHLGSTRLLTRVDRSVYDSLDYLPFGEQVSGDTGTTHKFTGKERDPESSLDYFGARHYAFTVGRFVQPDPIYIARHRKADPQLLNLYQYARNSPVNLTDRTGLDVGLDCKEGQQQCNDTVDDLNNRKDKEFGVAYNEKTGLLEIVGDVKGEDLKSEGEKALYDAITNKEHHATLSVVGESDYVQFGRFDGNGTNTVDRSDLSLLGAASSQAAGEIIAHEVLEAYKSAQASNVSFEEAHSFADQFFGRITHPFKASCPVCSPAWNFRNWSFGRINIDMQVKTIETPVPDPFRYRYEPGRIVEVRKEQQ